MSVLLKKSHFDGITSRELAQQLIGKEKCRIKLPTWFDTENIYYPNARQIEQTSSEITARYKSEIAAGKTLIDATGGFGVDSYFLSKKIERVIHCEIDEELSQIAACNFEKLGAVNIRTQPLDGIAFLQQSPTTYDWIYLDPSRRNKQKAKVFMLSDCIPDVTEHLELLFLRSSNIMLKTSPLLDLSVGLKALKFVREIHVVAIQNEVKELLWVLNSGYGGAVTVKTINYRKKGSDHFNFDLRQEKKAIPDFSEPLKYLYEPNAAIMKAGAFKLIGIRYLLKKIQDHTHLYTSDTPVAFPGRQFKILKNLPYNRKEIKATGIEKANIATRNFPEKVTSIRKKLKIKDGGTDYLFFVRDQKNKLRVLFCAKI